MVQSINNSNIPVDINSVGSLQSKSRHVAENQKAQFKTSVQKLQTNFLNDATLLIKSRTVQSVSDIFTANMEGKGFGRIAQFFTNIGLYFQNPKKLLQKTENNINALQQLLHEKAVSGEKFTPAMIQDIKGCIQTADEALREIKTNPHIPDEIKQDFKNLYQKDIFTIHQNCFLENVTNGITLSKNLTNLNTEKDFKTLEKFVDTIDMCAYTYLKYNGTTLNNSCRKDLVTILFKQFLHITDGFLKDAENFITSVEHDISTQPNNGMDGFSLYITPGKESDKKYKELLGKLCEYTTRIRPFYDALRLANGKTDRRTSPNDFWELSALIPIKQQKDETKQQQGATTTFADRCDDILNRFSKAVETIKNKRSSWNDDYSDKFSFLKERK